MRLKNPLLKIQVYFGLYLKSLLGKITKLTKIEARSSFCACPSFNYSSCFVLRSVTFLKKSNLSSSSSIRSQRGKSCKTKKIKKARGRKESEGKNPGVKEKMRKWDERSEKWEGEERTRFHGSVWPFGVIWVLSHVINVCRRPFFIRFFTLVHPKYEHTNFPSQNLK